MPSYYFIQNIATGAYLAARPGATGVVWTKRLKSARVFRSQAEAELERCKDDEIIVSLESQLDDA